MEGLLAKNKREYDWVYESDAVGESAGGAVEKRKAFKPPRKKVPTPRNCQGKAKCRTSQ